MSVVCSSSKENGCCQKISNFIQKHGLKMLTVAFIVGQVAVLSYFSLTYGAASALAWVILGGMSGLVSLNNRVIQEKTFHQKQIAQPLEPSVETPQETKPVDKFVKCIKFEQPSEKGLRAQAEARKKARQEARLDMALDIAADLEEADQEDDAIRAKERAKNARLAARKGSQISG